MEKLKSATQKVSSHQRSRKESRNQNDKYLVIQEQDLAPVPTTSSESVHSPRNMHNHKNFKELMSAAYQHAATHQNSQHKDKTQKFGSLLGHSLLKNKYNLENFMDGNNSQVLKTEVDQIEEDKDDMLNININNNNIHSLSNNQMQRREE